MLLHCAQCLRFAFNDIIDIEDDGIYCYDAENNCVESIEPQHLVDVLVNQNVDFDLDPDKLFKPSNRDNICDKAC